MNEKCIDRNSLHFHLVTGCFKLFITRNVGLYESMAWILYRIYNGSYLISSYLIRRTSYSQNYDLGPWSFVG